MNHMFDCPHCGVTTAIPEGMSLDSDDCDSCGRNYYETPLPEEEEMPEDNLAVVPPRQKAEARAQRLRDLGSSFVQELADAFNEKDYLELGYSSWSEYCASELNGRIALPRVKGDRVDFVRSLSESGLSQRAIAEATNMSRNTVTKYLSPEVAQFEPPAKDQDAVVEARKLTNEIKTRKAELSKLDPTIGDVFDALTDKWVIRAIQLGSLTPIEVYESFLRREHNQSGATADEVAVDSLIIGLLTRTGRYISGFNPDIPLPSHFFQENN